MEKIVNITHKDRIGNDKQYWATKSYAERLEALEFLRQQYLEFINAPERLQRVFRIVDLKQK